MSENWAIALVIFVLGQGCAFALAGLAAFFNLVRGQNDMRVDLTKLQGQMDGMLMRNSVIAAGIAHSPDNHHGLDEYLEEYNELYLKHHGDMGIENWIRFRDIFAEALRDKEMNAITRAALEIIVNACEHKMEGCGMLAVKPRPK